MAISHVFSVLASTSFITVVASFHFEPDFEAWQAQGYSTILFWSCRLICVRCGDIGFNRSPLLVSCLLGVADFSLCPPSFDAKGPAWPYLNHRSQYSFTAGMGLIEIVKAENVNNKRISHTHPCVHRFDLAPTFLVWKRNAAESGVKACSSG
eukprot:scaffold2028_cov191-Amphora_coffeaeformis.AAC.10